MDKKNIAKGRLARARGIFPIGQRQWATRAITGFLTGVALLMGGQAVAHDSHEATGHYIEASTHPTLPFVDLGVMDSTQGEAKNDYMMRVAGVLDQFTKTSGHEACGVIMEHQDGGEWRVRLTTNRSQVACAYMIFDEPGFLFTDETIHSHPRPRGGVIRANAQDQQLAGFACNSRLRIDDRDFSPGDMKNTAGYLVARGRLLYQRDGEKQLIGDIDNSTIEGLVSLPNDSGRMVAPRSQRMLSALVKARLIQVPSPAAWSSTEREGLPSITCKAKGK